MQIGTLIFEVYGELKLKSAIESLQSSMYEPLISVSDYFDFRYNRFGFYAGFMIWEIPLKVFWKNDQIYSTLRTNLNKLFTNWQIDISLTLSEKGV